MLEILLYKIEQLCLSGTIIPIVAGAAAVILLVFIVAREKWKEKHWTPLGREADSPDVGAARNGGVWPSKTGKW